MIRNRQIPWLRDHAVLVQLVLVRAVRPKQTLKAKYRPIAEVHAVESLAAKLTLPTLRTAVRSAQVELLQGRHRSSGIRADRQILS